MEKLLRDRFVNRRSAVRFHSPAPENSPTFQPVGGLRHRCAHLSAWHAATFDAVTVVTLPDGPLTVMRLDCGSSWYVAAWVKDHSDAAFGAQGDHEFRLDVFLSQARIVVAADQREEQRPFYGREVCPDAGPRSCAEGKVCTSGIRAFTIQPSFRHEPIRVRPEGRVPMQVVHSDEDDRFGRQGDAADRDGARGFALNSDSRWVQPE